MGKLASLANQSIKQTNERIRYQQI